MEEAKEREWDMKRSFQRILYPAIFAYIIFSSIFLYFLQYSTLNEDGQLIAGGLALFILGFMFLYTAFKTIKRQMLLARYGYNVQEESTRPWFIYGSKTFELYRIDKGFGMGATSKTNEYKNKLAERQKKQRELECEICETELDDGGYFIERRKISRIFYIPFTEEIEEVEGYCSNHKPDQLK